METGTNALEGRTPTSARGPLAPQSHLDHKERMKRFGAAIDAVRERVEAKVGPEDVAHVRRVDRFSRAMEVIGRVLIHVSMEPVTFSVGVGALWLHKQLQATEVGHTALHGAYDRLEDAEEFNSKTFSWDVPIDEESWRYGHNIRPDRSWKSVKEAHIKALRKWVPYYLKNYGLFPLLAGPMFWKVLLGNWMAETMRDLYSAATIYCGHVGEDVAAYDEGTRAHGRGEWYAMQIESTNNYEVSLPVSILCGGLDRQIEHHLFPRLPPNRLREIAPEVRAVCAEHGVTYRTASWGSTLKKALAHVRALGFRDFARTMA